MVPTRRKPKLADDWAASSDGAARPSRDDTQLPRPEFLALADRPVLVTAMTRLQAQAGNRAVQRALAARPVVVSRNDDVTRSKISETTTDLGNKFTQELVLNKTQKSISVNLGVKWVKKGTWASDTAYNAFIRKIKTAAYSYLDNKFKVVCTPTAPAAGPAPIELPISFLIYDDSGGYQIEVHGGQPGTQGSAMGEAGGKVYEYQSATELEDTITFAHEFGHALLGLADEYASPSAPHRVLSNDHSIMGNYYAQGKDHAEFKARHFQHIVPEVAKAFAGYTCAIKTK